MDSKEKVEFRPLFTVTWWVVKRLAERSLRLAVCIPAGPVIGKAIQELNVVQCGRMKSTRRVIMRKQLLIAGILVSLVAASAMAFPPTGIYSNLAGHPTNLVPGLGISFNPGLTSQFDRPYRSADGNYWILTALAQTGNTATDEVIIVGSGTTGMTVFQEGVTTLDGGRTCESASIDQRVSINDAGNFAFTCNLSGATTDDEVIVKSIGGTLSIAAREGTAVGPLIAGASLGATLDTPGIDNNNKVSFRSTLTGPPTGQTTAVFLQDMDSVAMQYGVTAVNPPTPGGNLWQTLAAGDAFYHATTSDWFAQGDTNGTTTTDAIVAKNNQVLLNEGSSPGGGLGNVLSFVESFMFPGGDWMSRGTINGSPDDDWVVYNGNVVSKGFDLVPGGLPGERFDDASFAALYFAMAANDVGHYVYGGVTDNSDLDRNAVLVWSDGVTSNVVLREGDPVDLDGNGLLDDNVFLSVFNNDDMFLTNDGWLYFFADLRNTPASPFTNVGQAFMRIQVPEPSTLALLGLGMLTLVRRRRAN